MNDIEKAIDNLKETLRMQKSALRGLPISYQPKAGLNDDIKATNLAISALEKQLNNGWIPCSERLPDEKENPITWDYYEYTVTICIRGEYDIRHYKFGRGKWWNGGADMSSIVIAWQPLPEPYKEASE